MSLYNKYSGIPPGWIFQLQLIIFKCTSTKIKSERSECKLSCPTRDLLFFFSLLFVFPISISHSDAEFLTERGEHIRFSNLLSRSCRSLHLRHGTNTHRSCKHTHTHTHTHAIQFPVETERKYPLRKRKKKKNRNEEKINKYKPCCCLLY